MTRKEALKVAVDAFSLLDVGELNPTQVQKLDEAKKVLLNMIEKLDKPNRNKTEEAVSTIVNIIKEKK